MAKNVISKMPEIANGLNMKEFSEIGGDKPSRFSKKQHHRYFEFNCGSQEFQLDKWRGRHHDGIEEKMKKIENAKEGCTRNEYIAVAR